MWEDLRSLRNESEEEMAEVDQKKITGARPAKGGRVRSRTMRMNRWGSMDKAGREQRKDSQRRGVRGCFLRSTMSSPHSKYPAERKVKLSPRGRGEKAGWVWFGNQTRNGQDGARALSSLAT